MLVSLDDTVVFPGMPVTLSFDSAAEKHVFLIPRQDGNYAKVGVIAEVTERVQLPGRGYAVSLVGRYRGVPGAASTDSSGRLRVDVEERPDQIPAPTLTHDLEREYRAVAEEILELRGDDGRLSAYLRSITNTGMLADTAGYAPDLTIPQKIQLLETFDVVERLRLALKFQQERLTELHLRKRIRDEVESGAQKQQREYLLRRQMEAIRKELGETDGSVIEEYRKKIADAKMPEHGPEAGRTRALAARAHGRTERRSFDDSEPISIGCSRCHGRNAPRNGSIQSTRGRSSTKITRDSTTSKSASPNISPFANCAPSADSSTQSGREQFSRSSDLRVPVKHRSANPSLAPRVGNSSACHSAAFAMRRRSAVIGAHISARCRVVWFVPCAMPER